jgi:acylphosphatase
MQDDSTQLACMRAYVSGRVQGVFFRQSTRQQALALGLCGYAKNLPDGRVEVWACGSAAQVRELESWLWKGPGRAEVETVEAQYLPYEAADGFYTA